VSDFLGAECFAVAVQPTGDLSGLPTADREAMERHLNFARNLHIETRVLEGDDVASTLVDFGRRNQVTQIYLTRPRRRSWPPAISRDPAQRIIGLAKDILIVIVSDREPVTR
jgi:two-component system sensor histidine kinase KdpD